MIIVIGSMTICGLFLLQGTTCCKNKYMNYRYFKTSCYLTQVPTDIPAEAKMVNLQYNKIGFREPRTFSHLTQCTDLSMTGNSLIHIRRGIFQGLLSLRYLDLHSNTIGDIDSEAFLPLKQCASLWLSQNELTSLRVEMLNGLYSLDTLDLHSNQISFIEPGTFSHLPLLRTLYLNNNQLITPMDEQDLPHSQNIFLFLDQNPLQCDSRMCWIKKAERDRRITLHSRSLGEKPECVNYPEVHWDNVRLNCDTPDIVTKVEHAMTDPSTITNASSTLPLNMTLHCENPFIYCKPNSAIVNISSQNIRNDTIALDLRNNAITALYPDSFPGCTNLSILLLSGNAISTILPGAFKDQNNLIYLDLGHNRLMSINGEIWMGLMNLEILRLTGNKIKTIKYEGFSHLTHSNTIVIDISILATHKETILAPSSYPDAKSHPKVAPEEANFLVCDHSNCWLKKLEARNFFAHYEKNGRPSRPKCFNMDRYWDEVDLNCTDATTVTTIQPPTSPGVSVGGIVAIICAVVGVVLVITVMVLCCRSMGLRLTHPEVGGDNKEYNAAYRCGREDGPEPLNNVYDYIDEAAMLPLQRCLASTGSRTDHSDPSE